MTNFREFDASEYLTTPEAQAEYLTASLEDENPKVFLGALADVAKARGMTDLARAAGIGREPPQQRHGMRGSVRVAATSSPDMTQ